MSKICNICGYEVKGKKCTLCKTEFGSNYSELPDLELTRPELITFLKRNSKNWIERIEQHYEILKHEIDSNTKKVVDLGCGPNIFVKLIKQYHKGIEAYGYDFIPKAKDVRQLDFEHEKLPVENDDIDIIFLSHVLEHVDNLHFILDEVFRAAKKIILAFPNDYNIFRFIRGALGKDLGGNMGLPLIQIQDRHKWIYTVEQLDRLMGYYAYKFNKKYKRIYFAHRKANTLLVKLNKNLFASEIMYIHY